MATVAPPPRESPAWLSPPPYHWAVRDHLKNEEAELWRWFSSNQVRAEHAEAVRLDLLRTTYRLEAATQPRLYELAEEVLGRLQLKLPVTFYQAQAAAGLNAELAFLPGEAHIILFGSVMNTLSAAELQAVLGHELVHFLLYDRWDGEMLVVSEILQALSNDASAHPCHLESSRLFRLYSEIFADRGALAVTGDPLVAIATLIKLGTGLTEVNAESYLRQAEEIFTKSQVKANELTHPEPYIRARALKLFAEQGEAAGPEIELIIEGAPTLNRLDLVGRQRVANHTRRLVQHFLVPAWFQTEPVLAHARLFFPDVTPETDADFVSMLAEQLERADQSLQDYYCYVLLDFVAADRDLEEAPLAAALTLCERLGVAKRFSLITARELAMTKKRLAAIERDAVKILDHALASTGTS
jgi:Zn-dependent protease with chaperone function